MPAIPDHTILPAKDKDKSAKFYEKIFNFTDLGEESGSGLRGLRVSESFVLFLEDPSDGSSWTHSIHHFAFGMDEKEFDRIFGKLKSSNVPYGDHYSSPRNMKPPKKAPGAKGM